MANVEHPVNYRRAVLREMAAPSSIRATPDITDITQQHAAAQGQIAAVSEASKDKLAEQDRQFMAKLDMNRQMLDTWGEQNKWATAIAVANLGVQALGIPAQAKTLERQEAILKGFADEGLKRIAMTNTATEAGIAARKKEAAEEKARHEAIKLEQELQKIPIYGGAEPGGARFNLPETPDIQQNDLALQRMPGSGLPLKYRH